MGKQGKRVGRGDGPLTPSNSDVFVISEEKLSSLNLSELRDLGKSLVLQIDFDDPILTREDIISVLQANSL